MSDMKELLDEMIYPKLRHEQIFGDLDGFRDRGDYFTANCPYCGTEDHWMMPASHPYGYCRNENKCGQKKNWFDYVKETEGLTDKGTLERLAEMAGIDLPTHSTLPKSPKRNRRSVLYEEAFRICQREMGQEVMDYLKSRGYEEDTITRMEVGEFPAPEKFKAFMQKAGYDESDLQRERLLTGGFGTAYRLVIPYRDEKGACIGFIGRCLVAPPDGQPKYKLTGGTRRMVPLGLHRLQSDSAIVVEGYIDSLVLPIRGIDTVVATGTAGISQAQLQALRQKGIRKLYLNFDEDQAGYKATDRALGHIASMPGLRAFVVELDGAKDPDEYVVKNGVEAYRAKLQEALHGPRWMVRRRVKAEVLQDPERDVLVEQIADYLVPVQSHDPLGYEAGKEEVENLLGISRETMERIVRERRERLEGEERQRISKRLAANIQEAAEKGDGERQRYWVEQLNRHLAGGEVGTARPLDVEAVFHQLQKASKGTSTGYADLDPYISLDPGTLNVIAGRPGVGKTTLGCNLLLHLLEQEEERPVLFFSYEASVEQVVTKLIAILSSSSYRQVQHLFREGLYRGKLGDACRKLEHWQSRLFILDKSGWTVEQLVAYSRTVRQEHGPLGVLLVDYAQRVKVGQRKDTEELRVAHVVETLNQAGQELVCPVVALAQLNRSPQQRSKEHQRPQLSDLRYSGSLEQEPAVVLGLHRDAEQEKEAEVVPLEVWVLKDRYGQKEVSVKLDFHLKSGRIMDRKKKDPWGK
jgi:DNA primase